MPATESAAAKGPAGSGEMRGSREFKVGDIAYVEHQEQYYRAKVRVVRGGGRGSAQA